MPLIKDRITYRVQFKIGRVWINTDVLDKDEAESIEIGLHEKGIPARIIAEETKQSFINATI